MAVKSKIHLLFFTIALGGGGAEMVFLRIINQLNRDFFQISLALIQAGGSYESALAEDVDVHYLLPPEAQIGKIRYLKSILPLRKLIQSLQPDLVFSALEPANFVTLLATRFLPTSPRLVLSVHNTPSYIYQRSTNPFYRLSPLFMTRIYPYADAIVAVSQGVASDLRQFLPKGKPTIQVIYNPCVDQRVLVGAEVPLPQDLTVPKPLVVACGRLKPQKGFLDLLVAFEQVQRAIPAHLWIIGEGEQRRILETRIRELHLQQSVTLIGFQANPYQYIAAGDLFVLSSQFEGFGIVIVEAMACGVPVVAYDCPSGPNEIINADQVNGVLVPPGNPQALAQSILTVLSDETFRHSLAINGRERARAFDVQSVTLAYEQLFQQLTA